MFNQIQYVKDIHVAIDSVRSRAKKAIASGNNGEATLLMGDLYALELCLDIESRKLIINMEFEKFIKEAA